MFNRIRKLFTLIGNRIRTIIDFFYPPFRRWFSPQLFRYAVCGVSNMGFNLVLFSIMYNFVFAKELVDVFGIVTLRPFVAAFLVVFPITLMTGFLLQKYVTFTTSLLRGKVQLVRYTSVVMLNILINYVGLHFFVEIVGFWATPSQFIVNIVNAVVSYLCQKYFTFREIDMNKENEKRE
jgi:putative flippase GtrA